MQNVRLNKQPDVSDISMRKNAYIQSDVASITLRIIAVIMLSCVGVAVRQSVSSASKS